MVRPLSGAEGERSMTIVETVSYGMCVSTETGGSATGLSATDAWHGAAVGDDTYVRLISAVARLSFSQKARILDSTNAHAIDPGYRFAQGTLFPPLRLSLRLRALTTALAAYGDHKWRAI
jgi:hypothetical protein